jgi:uncharacterized protein
MDVLLLFLGFLCVLGGVFGSFLPALPGPSLSWIGLLLLYMTSGVSINYLVLSLTFFITVSISFLDYIIPAKGAKKFGGTKYGVWGTNIGMIIGFFIPMPFGFIVGAFVGAFIGELWYDKQDKKRALKSATGSFLGFLVSSFMKFFVCMMFLGTFLVVVWHNKETLF